MSQTNPAAEVTFHLDGETLILGGSLTLGSIQDFLDYFDEKLKTFKGNMLTIELDRLEKLDSAGAAAVQYIRDKLSVKKIRVEISMARDQTHFHLMDYSAGEGQGKPKGEKEGFFERIGSRTRFIVKENLVSYLALAADITTWFLISLIGKRAHRKGDVINQAVLMGVNAALIVGIMAFIIGLVLALQTAAQLKIFGANIYIVDLTVIAMMSEMGPLITAIIVAGRSGSSIAAEISTMKVTSELDALKTMGLNPVRFLVVPKLYGGLITMPFLTILANVMGILGGLIVAMGYLDISPAVFLNRMEQSLHLKDIVFGIVKSLVFVSLIVMTGSYFGFRAEQGASGVGKVTTRAVVVSISLVILADSIMGLMFY